MQSTQDTGILNAYKLLQSNKTFIQTEIVAWINDAIVGSTTGIWHNFEYNSDKCFRDVGYILDSISFDLLYGGNRQSIQAGTYYYGYTETDSSIPNEKIQAIFAYDYLKSLLGYIVKGEKIEFSYQTYPGYLTKNTPIEQVTHLPIATSDETAIVQQYVDVVTGIIKNGPGVPGVRTPIGLTESTDYKLKNAADLLIANRDFLAAEINAFIDNITPASFTYNSSKCQRDVGLIVDCIGFDLSHGGNRQAAQAGVYYFDNSATVSIVPSEKTDTVNAFTYMGYLMEAVLKGNDISNDTTLATTDFRNAPYQTTAIQNTLLNATTNNYISIARGYITTLNKIITNGPSEATDPTLRTAIWSDLYDVEELDADALSAYEMLMANKPYIIAEVIGYMNSLKTPNTTKIYTTPPGITSIVLMAQVANVTDHDINVTFSHYRNIPVFADPSTQNGFQAGDTITELVKDFTIPPNDSATLINGKMIVETFDSVLAYASENGGLKVTLSILETANA
jgi:hypothetical protein